MANIAALLQELQDQRQRTIDLLAPFESIVRDIEKTSTVYRSLDRGAAIFDDIAKRGRVLECLGNVPSLFTDERHYTARSDITRPIALPARLVALERRVAELEAALVPPTEECDKGEDSRPYPGQYL